MRARRIIPLHHKLYSLTPDARPKRPRTGVIYCYISIHLTYSL